MTFEENMNALSEIVGQLEKGDLPLEKSVELYGNGVKIAEMCRKELEAAKLKITQYGEENNGTDS
ncbi:MAG: exodeoxyribonuclease VII small subunit [Clostridium sp.]|nr:exodeoxyribonuclease VII small subunit [Clostridium sp.]MCM1547360.1 exodeoxyribonuclease VII small subunit [Ruminococcus sp.]